MPKSGNSCELNRNTAVIRSNPVIRTVRADNNQQSLLAATIAGGNTFHRDFITPMIKSPPVVDDLNNEIFIFINNAVMAIA